VSYEVHPEGGIYDVRLGYHSKTEGYATSMSDIRCWATLPYK